MPSLRHARRSLVAAAAVIALAAALAVAFAGLARAATPQAATPQATIPRAATADDTPAQTRNGAAIYLAGLALVDQNGKTVDLYKDYIAGHGIVLHSFFTRCEGSCPVMMTTLQALQKRLGPRLGRDVQIVSITVDPGHDTPEVLAAYARRVQAKPGWHFLGGSSEQVNTALRRIGQYADAPENHMNLIIVGNESSGDWRKLHGLAPLREVVEQLLDAVGGPH
ncbi:protein SCO1/2 [Tahibacter aquaticus]|uniref:Protein SCO1/2 n=2 Tax=Tahibacter aquaticus TaxID=520092 RepID=A0A4R6YNP8_9GAMM|nr:protein SCO1/2 [Tahibacter aquaticus]